MAHPCPVKLRAVLAALLLVALTAGCAGANKAKETTSASSPTSTQASGAVTPEQARAIAKEAYIYGFPMVDSYRIQYSYFVDSHDPEYKGDWNQVHSIARVYTPADTAVQTPNSDTPYSMLGADLRTEPLVLTVPPIEQDRYFSLQFVDGYTYNFAYVGSRTTGTAAASTCWPAPAGKARSPRASTKSSQPTPTSHWSSTAPNCSVPTTWTTSRRSRPATRCSRCRRSSTNPRPLRRRRSTSCRR